MRVLKAKNRKTTRVRPPSDSGKIGWQPKEPLVGEPPRPIDPLLPRKRPPVQTARDE
jgi:hypothetical protein